VYAEALRQYKRERYTTDSEFREKILRQKKERFANDLAFRERETQRSHESWQAKISRLEQDPEAHKLYKSEHNESVKAFYHQSAEYRWSQSVRQRCDISARFRDEVVWKRHEIVSYPTKTNHRCATCNHTKFKGLKLWYVVLDTPSIKAGNPVCTAQALTIPRWRRKNEPDKYDCWQCFQADREASTPVYYPSDLAPLPDRGPAKRPEGPDDKADEKSSTG